MVEHATVKHLIAEIEAMEVGDDFYDAKVRILGEDGEASHAGRRRRAVPRVEPAGMDLYVVGNELMKRKEKLMAEMQT
ncbi:MAG: hypothetical protein ACJ8AH_26590 [Stellaceae bacterium]